MPVAHHRFWSGPFSQWFACEFTLDGVTYGTAEQAMMHGKALIFGDQDTAARNMASTDPGRQKALGRQVAGFEQTQWDTHKTAQVTRINLAKFGQNKGLRRKPFQTGNVPLAEASPLDIIWGIGLDAAAAASTPSDEWPGQSLPGRILTGVRETLAQEHPTEPAACAPQGGQS